MIHVECRGCGTFTQAVCICPPGRDMTVYGHVAACAMTDVDGLIECPPASGCCQEDHGHAQDCPRTHPGECGLGVAGCAVCRVLVITWTGAMQLQRAEA